MEQMKDEVIYGMTRQIIAKEEKKERKFSWNILLGDTILTRFK